MQLVYPGGEWHDEVRHSILIRRQLEEESAPTAEDHSCGDESIPHQVELHWKPVLADEARETFPQGRVRGRSGRRAERQAGGVPVRGACRLAPQTRALVAYTSRQWQEIFYQMTVFFSTHCIEVFASIYGS
jgi:hypothetical protein